MENLRDTELTLGLPGVIETQKDSEHRPGKRTFSEFMQETKNENKWLSSSPPASKCAVSSSESEDLSVESHVIDPETPSPTKVQAVGWPPVRSFMRSTMATNSKPSEEKLSNGGALYVKVSMDGAPYLRKVDLQTYRSYHKLSSALEKMFSCFTVGQGGLHGLSQSKEMDLLNGSEYVFTYEDKDGDWMLVGDVPWEMFVDSCKRIRIMTASEDIGLAPRVTQCKNGK